MLNKNIVLIGEFKPSLFDKLFFIKNEILREEDFLEDSFFLPDLTIINTKNFFIEIRNNRLTLNYKELTNNVNISILKFDSIIENSSLRAFGFNIKIALFINNKSESKKYFYFKDNILNKHFPSGDDVAYGYYVSKDLDSGCRLKLDIKPVQLQKIGENKMLDALDFNFNFHFENSDLKKAIEKYKSFENLTLEIVNDYE